MYFFTGQPVETNPLICRGNKSTGFHFIGSSVMDELKVLHKILKFHLISWCRNFGETDSYRRISGNSPRKSADTVRFPKVFTPES